MVTCPRLAPSSVDVTIRLFGVRVPSGRARTVVVSSEEKVDMQPARAPPALSPLVADDTRYAKPERQQVTVVVSPGAISAVEYPCGQYPGENTCTVPTTSARPACVKPGGQHAESKASPPIAFCMNRPDGLALKSEGSYDHEELQLGGGVKMEVNAI